VQPRYYDIAQIALVAALFVPVTLSVRQLTSALKIACVTTSRGGAHRNGHGEAGIAHEDATSIAVRKADVTVAGKADVAVTIAVATVAHVAIDEEHGLTKPITIAAGGGGLESHR